MTYKQLQELIILNLQDASPEVLTQVPRAINDTCARIAERVAIPSLKSYVTTVTVVGRAWVQLPSSMSERILRVTNSDGDILHRFSSLEQLQDYRGDLLTAGSLECYAVEGTTLWYSLVPSTATTLNILGYLYPTVLVLDTDEPTFLPKGLHEGLLVGGTAVELWNLIEQGVDLPSRVNLNTAIAVYDTALNGLHNWISGTKRHRGMDTTHVRGSYEPGY